MTQAQAQAPWQQSLQMSQDDVAWLRGLGEFDPPTVNAAMQGYCVDKMPVFCAVALGERFTSAFNKMHADFLLRPKKCWRERRKPQKWADAAPRAGAKSTVDSYASIIHDVVYGMEVYVAVISTTSNLSQDLVKDLHAAFTDREANEELHRIWGPFTLTGTSTDFVVHAPAGEPLGTRVCAFSFSGAGLRGTKHKGKRPSKVLIDDGERLEATRTPGQRHKTHEIFQKDIMKAGARYTIYRVIGTVLHEDALLPGLLSAPGWFGTKYRAVIQWPDDTSLWAECREVWGDLTNEYRAEDAEDFYEANQEAMDEGAEVLWPEHEPLWDLMVELWDGGEAAFNSEKQNEPRDPALQVFDTTQLKRCKWDGAAIITSAEGRQVNIRDCTVGVWLDPIPPKDGPVRGDFAAIAVVARDQYGYRYVLEVVMKRMPPHAQRAIMWAFFDRFGSRAKYGYENNGFAALSDEGFLRERTTREKKGLQWQLNPKGITSTENKEARITRLEPDCAVGWLQWSEAIPPAVMEQVRDFPSASHDDGFDAVEGADRLVSQTQTIQRGNSFGRR